MSTVAGDTAGILWTGRALMRPDGSIVVVDEGRMNVKLMDSNGRPMTTIGRRGAGPGEFRGIKDVVAWPDGRITVLDVQLNRVSEFDKEGRFQRVVGVGDWQSRLVALAGPTGDGRMLAVSRMEGAPSPSAGVVRDSLVATLWSPEEARHDTVATFLGTEYLAETAQEAEGDLRIFAPRPFGAISQVAVVGNVVAVSGDGSAAIARLDLAGRVMSVVRLNRQSVRVDEADLESWCVNAIGGPGAEARRHRLCRLARRHGLPRERPRFGRMLAGPNGTLWVAGYALTWEERPTIWSVIDSTGEWAGDVRFPRGFTLYQLPAEGLALGRLVDDDGLEYLQVLRLATGRR